MRAVRAVQVHALAAGLLVGLSLIALSSAASPQSQSRSAQIPPAKSGTFRDVSSRAIAARDAQRLDEAVPLFRKALALNAKWTEGWWSLGTIYYDSDRYAEGAFAFQKVVQLDPKLGTARAMLGLCEFELGQNAEALRDIEASKSLGVAEDPQLRQVVLYHEGELLRRTGRFEAAQKSLSSLCLAGVRSEELALTFGMAALRMRSDLPPAQGTEDADVVQHVGRGACLAAQKNYDLARPEFEFAISHHPHFPYVYDAYGQFLMDAHDTAGAIRAFKQEITEAPDNVLPRLRIAAAEYKVDSTAGLPFAEEAVRMAPKLPFAHYLLGLLLIDTGAYAKAIPHLEIAHNAFPQEAKIDLALGSAYAQVGRPQDAARARAEFLRLSREAQQKAQSATPEPKTYGSPQIEVTDGADAVPRQ